MDAYEAQVVKNVLRLLNQVRDNLDIIQIFSNPSDPGFVAINTNARKRAREAVIDAMAELENLQ